MTHILKTQTGTYTLSFNLTFLRLLHRYYQHESIGSIVDTLTSLVSEAENSSAEGDLKSLFIKTSDLIVQMVRCGHESWRRSQGDTTPVSEVEAENILNGLGISPIHQVQAWGGIVKDFMVSVGGFLSLPGQLSNGKPQPVKMQKSVAVKRVKVNKQTK